MSLNRKSNKNPLTIFWYVENLLRLSIWCLCITPLSDLSLSKEIEFVPTDFNSIVYNISPSNIKQSHGDFALNLKLVLFPNDCAESGGL